MRKQRSLGMALVLPFMVLTIVVLIFLNVKHIPFEFSDKDGVVLRYAVKVLATILIPLTVIRIFYKNRADFGLYLPKYRDSFKLAFKAYTVGGPACMTFLLIGLLGWSIVGWRGAALLSVVFAAVFYLVPKVTEHIPTRRQLASSNNRIRLLTVGSLITLVIAFSTYSIIELPSKILYYLFIVGFGEELLFRGYLQSAFNGYFGKPFKLGNVSFGWGLILAAALFGLIHAVVTVPPTWPHAVWTFVFGLTLGFIREKDGSILGAVLLHAMMDMPLAFMT